MAVLKTLFHGAPVCVRASIFAEGIRVNWEGVYASDTVGGAAAFTWLRCSTHMPPEALKAFPAEGSDPESPEYRRWVELLAAHQHHALDVWEFIEGDPSDWQEGADHNPEFFGDAVSLLGRKPVPANRLVGLHLISMDDEGEFQVESLRADEVREMFEH